MASEYLLKEYELCFEQLRFYDARNGELTKYLFTLSSAVIAAEFAFLKYLGSATSIFYLGLGVLSFVVFVATVLIYTCMLENRAYFVFVSRQINAIRGYLLASDAPEFKDNQMYTRVDFRAFRLRSLHTVHLVGTIFVSSVFAGATTYGLAVTLNLTRCVAVSMAAASVVGTVEFILGVLFLTAAGNKHADDFLARKS